jgi:hypothetical protein
MSKVQELNSPFQTNITFTFCTGKDLCNGEEPCNVADLCNFADTSNSTDTSNDTTPNTGTARLAEISMMMIFLPASLVLLIFSFQGYDIIYTI